MLVSNAYINLHSSLGKVGTSLQKEKEEQKETSEASGDAQSPITGSCEEEEIASASIADQPCLIFLCSSDQVLHKCQTENEKK